MISNVYINVLEIFMVVDFHVVLEKDGVKDNFIHCVHLKKKLEIFVGFYYILCHLERMFHYSLFSLHS